MRMSDWSSDVCSSDLTGGDGEPDRRRRARLADDTGRSQRPSASLRQGRGAPRPQDGPCDPAGVLSGGYSAFITSTGRPSGWSCGPTFAARSEEHTSELKSLMRNSYAVFCLKKK